MQCVKYWKLNDTLSISYARNAVCHEQCNDLVASTCVCTLRDLNIQLSHRQGRTKLDHNCSLSLLPCLSPLYFTKLQERVKLSSLLCWHSVTLTKVLTPQTRVCCNHLKKIKYMVWKCDCTLSFQLKLFFCFVLILWNGCQFGVFNITLRFVLVDMIQKGFRFITHTEVQLAPFKCKNNNKCCRCHPLL